MKLNSYGRQLLPAEIDAKEHREFVGGLWEELGVLQFDFLKNHGLEAHHKLLDVGCGALRGGVRFVSYLDAGNYYGMDINASLVEAGKRELAEKGLEGKGPHLLVADRFDLRGFATTFDCVLAVSVFTHLPINHIVRSPGRESAQSAAAGRALFRELFRGAGHRVPRSAGALAREHRDEL